MGVVKITSVYMLMGMLILISLYMKTCSIALLLVFPNLVTYSGWLTLKVISDAVTGVHSAGEDSVVVLWVRSNPPS